jgi:hypothetical protein
MADWLQWLTFGTSAVAAVGSSAAAAVTGRNIRHENDRTWERDHVTERYTAMYSALRGLDSAYVESIERRLMDPSTPETPDEG